jgi:GTP-binding protein HflX
VVPLQRELLRRVRTRMSVVELRIPAGDGRALAEVYREGEVLEQRTDGDVVVIRARLDIRTAGRLRQRVMGEVL